jgi:hypothetical protein
MHISYRTPDYKSQSRILLRWDLLMGGFSGVLNFGIMVTEPIKP